MSVPAGDCPAVTDFMNRAYWPTGYKGFNIYVDYMCPALDSWGSQDILPGFGRFLYWKSPGDPRSNRGESAKSFEGLPGAFSKAPWVATPTPAPKGPFIVTF